MVCDNGDAPDEVGGQALEVLAPDREVLAWEEPDGVAPEPDFVERCHPAGECSDYT